MAQYRKKTVLSQAKMNVEIRLIWIVIEKNGEKQKKIQKFGTLH